MYILTGGITCYACEHTLHADGFQEGDPQCIEPRGSQTSGQYCSGHCMVSHLH